VCQILGDFQTIQNIDENIVIFNQNARNSTNLSEKILLE